MIVEGFAPLCGSIVKLLYPYLSHTVVRGEGRSF
jgi:hypothetical protein